MKKTTKAIIISVVALVMLAVCAVSLVSCGLFKKHQESDVSQSDLVSLTDVSKSDETISTTEEAATTVPEETTTTTQKVNTRYRITVFTGSQTTVVYGKDSNGQYTKVVKCFTCSMGLPATHTPSGKYSVETKSRWQRMGNVYVQYATCIGNHYWFHSVPYKAENPGALDDAAFDKLGSPASHGCIRMCVRDCKWIYDNVPKYTEVTIVSKKGPAGRTVPARSKDPIYAGWDPTDKWAEGNPYFDESLTTSTSETAAQDTTAATAAPTSATEAPTSATEAPTSTTTTTTAAPADVSSDDGT